MEYKIDDIKLKHLDLVSQSNPNLIEIMEEVFHYKNTWLNNKLFFKKRVNKAISVIDSIRNIDISKTTLQKTNVIYPSVVDSLPFQARLEIEQAKQNANSVLQQIVDVIALACYTSHHKAKFNSDSVLFKCFKQYVSNQPLLQMVGLYNSLEKALLESNETWNKMFQQMHVVDIDYQEAGGESIMGRFNLLITAKNLQKDFRLPYEEAFLLPYNLVQMNNLQNASQNYLQERMTKIKERKFNAQKGV